MTRSLRLPGAVCAAFASPMDLDPTVLGPLAAAREPHPWQDPSKHDVLRGMRQLVSSVGRPARD
jgi:hypothetical protein